MQRINAIGPTAATCTAKCLTGATSRRSLLGLGARHRLRVRRPPARLCQQAVPSCRIARAVAGRVNPQTPCTRIGATRMTHPTHGKVVAVQLPSSNQQRE
jgi:hypothetical protein